MVLLNDEGKPIKYDTANDIMESFYTERLPYYELRKKKKLQKYKEEIDRLSYHMKYVNAINNKDLIVQNISKNMIYEKMTELGIPHTIYNNSKVQDLSKEDTSDLSSKINELTREYQKLEKITTANLWLNDLKAFENKYKQIYK
jgi:DNA gyrase/topoisomerase IV subunit A